jgi:hypothetical protein
MLVFIDESGDPGFKLDSGSSPVFVAAMVIFADRNAARATDRPFATRTECPKAWRPTRLPVPTPRAFITNAERAVQELAVR